MADIAGPGGGPSGHHGLGVTAPGGPRQRQVVTMASYELQDGRSLPAPQPRVVESLWEYARQVLMHWPWLVAGLVSLTLGVYSLVLSHILATRAWMWFAIGFGAWSVAQFLAFHEVRRERNDVLTGPTSDKVSIYAVAASRGDVPPPIIAPVDYQVHALRQATSFLRAEGHTEIDLPTLDSVLKRLERDGVQLPYEPLGASDCQAGLQRLVETRELIDVPEYHGFSYRLPPSILSG
jgi:hypothetical protein